MPTEKGIAIIAHDGKKAEMIAFVKDHASLFRNTKLVATGTTGQHLEQTGLKVKKLLSGPKGGDAQIAAMVAEGKLKAVLFFRDPLGKHPHEPDVQMLMRLCDLHNVALATNPSTAKYMVKGLEADVPADK